MTDDMIKHTPYVIKFIMYVPIIVEYLVFENWQSRSELNLFPPPLCMWCPDLTHPPGYTRTLLYLTSPTVVNLGDHSIYP